MSKITGTVTIRLDGEELLTDGKGTLNPGGYNREAKTGARGVVGFSETPVAPMVETSVYHDEDTDIVRLSNITGATLIFEADTGQKFMLRDAFSTEPAPLNGGDGTVALKFSGIGLERL